MKAYTLFLKNDKVVFQNGIFLGSKSHPEDIGINLSKEIITEDNMRFATNGTVMYLYELGVKKEHRMVTSKPSIPSSSFHCLEQNVTMYSACPLDEKKQVKTGVLVRFTVTAPNMRYGDGWNEIETAVQKISELFVSFAVKPNDYDNGESLVISGVTKDGIQMFKKKLADFAKYLDD